MSRDPPEPGSTKSFRYSSEVAIALVLAAVTLAVYARACGNDFVHYDDYDYVTENPHVQGGLSLAGAGWAFTTFWSSNWHPLTWLSLQLDYQLYGLKPWGFHLTNILFHAANTLLLFVVLRRITGAVWRSAVVSALFALHPLHVESVAWVSERKDVLSTLFWMLTLLAYEHYTRRPRLGRYVLVVLALALGLLAKPMLVTLPCVLLLLDYWPLRRHRGVDATRAPVSWRFLLLEKVPLLVLVTAASIVTIVAQQEGGAMRSPYDFTLWVRLENALVAYVTYIGKMFWPMDLAVFYPHPRGTLPLWQSVGAALILIGVTAAVIWARKRYPYLIVGWLWYLGTLVPVIGLVQVGWQAQADRYTYVPLIGLFLMLAWGVPDLLARRHGVRQIFLACSRQDFLPHPPHVHGAVPATLTAVVLTLCAILTWLQLGHWQNAITLWEQAQRVTPDNVIARHNLGLAFNRAGRKEEARAQYEAVLHLNSQDWVAHRELAGILWELGKHEEALQHYETAVRINPDDAATHLHFGQALLKLGRQEEAERHLREAVRLNPELPLTPAPLPEAGRGPRCRAFFLTPGS